MNSLPAWSVWALLSAVFAALTAVLAKVGVQGVSADYATLVRTLVIVAVLALLVPMSGQWVDPRTLPARSLLFLVLSGLAIWKPVQFQELAALMGGYEGARLVHFIAMALVVLFVLVHVVMVALVPRTFLPMLTGYARRPPAGQES